MCIIKYTKEGDYMNLWFTKKKSIVVIIMLLVFTLLGSLYVVSKACTERAIAQGSCSVFDSFFYTNSFLYFALPATVILYILMSIFQKNTEGSSKRHIKKSVKQVKKKAKRKRRKK